MLSVGVDGDRPVRDFRRPVKTGDNGGSFAPVFPLTQDLNAVDIFDAVTAGIG
ncbi:unnamed protein product [marine sediment metagenome]|uniref:Uncharacterized protein n=1 Tax=marine sediment metagenome TaxID=412755 RepID=X1ARI9_9ZZZZ